MRLARLRGPAGAEPEFHRLEGDEAVPLRGGEGRRFTLAELLAPVTPSKVVAIARNYAAHAKELSQEIPKEPLFFLKPPSSVVGPGAAISLPDWSREVHHEAELGVVVGTRMRRVPPERVRDHLLGFTCVNDVTARDVQRALGHFTRAKGADGFCPIGPWIETELPFPAEVVCRVSGAERQRGTTDQMIFGVEALLSFLSHSMTLEPGDVVATGTPAGVGPIRAGDVVEVEIAGLGVLSNPVVAQEP